MSAFLAFGPPLGRCRLREQPEDFRVIEQLGFAPGGGGEHLWTYIRKRGANTDWVAKQLARWADVPAMAVSYAGLKDRHAVTEQWFSIHLPGRPDPDPASMVIEGVECLDTVRHNRKLKRGGLKANRFEITLRDYDGDLGALETRWAAVLANGVPNAFGEQRFGRDAGNLDQARAWFAGGRPPRDKHQRGLLLSAARSAVFNAILERRIAERTWNQGLDGDVMMLDGSHSVFEAPQIDDTLRQRLQTGDIHPTGPLWGEGEPMTTGAVRALEAAVANEHADLCSGLLAARMNQERRSLRLPVGEGSFTRTDQGPVLGFNLPAGSYATVVVAQMVDY